MTWPTIFANLAGGNQSLALIDAMFTQVAQMVAVPCSATGANAVSLAPIGNAPTLPNYQNFSSFRFVAPATTTGLVTAQFQALGFLPVYISDGVTQASTGNILINQEYVLVFAQFLNTGAGGFFLESAAESLGASIFAPNVQVFTSGTALTYTTPTAAARLPLYLRVSMVGGGGGGAAATVNNGTAGAASSFAGWTALGGAGGAAGTGGAGGAGGAGGVNGTGTLITRMAGNGGAGGTGTSAGGNTAGVGGAGVFGGAGAGIISSAAGNAGAANSGAGGGGALQAGSINAGGGGGAGEYVEFIIPTPAANYTYTVGALGAGGAAGTFAGGNGGAGRIEVVAYWQ